MSDDIASNTDAFDLEDIAASAATFVSGVDSESEPEAPADEEQPAAEEPEDAPDDPDEGADDLTDPEDPETDLLDTEEDVEETEDPDDPDEDLEDLEDLEEDEEDPEPEDDLHAVTVQGETFEVPLQELKDGYQRQQDYTLKTQQVSQIYQKMAEWYETRANDPEMWVAEIVDGQQDQAATIAGALRQTGNVTTLLGQTLKHLVSSGDVADELVEALNLQQVAESAEDQSLELKVNSLEEQIRERDAREQEQQELEAVQAEIQNQWASVVQQNSLDPEDTDLYYQTLEFARDNGIPNLIPAYAAMTAMAVTSPQTTAQPKTQPRPKKQKKAKRAVKKRKTSAMSRKPAGGGAPSQSTAASDDPVNDAASEALSELFG